VGSGGKGEGEKSRQREKGFSELTTVEIRTCFGVMPRRKDAARTIHKGDTHPVTDRGVGQFEIA
jgi:hypothetical protein